MIYKFLDGDLLASVYLNLELN